MDILKKLSSVCNEMESFRRISFLQNDAYSMPTILLCKEIDFCTATSLTRELVQKLTNPGTTYDTVRYFTEYAAEDLHPCVIGEIFLKWWKVNCTEYHDISFIKTPFKEIDYIYDAWFFHAQEDIRYTELFETLLQDTFCSTYLCHHCTPDDDNLITLKPCIEEGDGADLTLPTDIIRNSPGMEVYRHNMPVFRYNTAIFPPYGGIPGQWYMAFCNEDHSHNVLSLTTESQQNILSYIDSCFSC